MSKGPRRLPLIGLLLAASAFVSNAPAQGGVVPGQPQPIRRSYRGAACRFGSWSTCAATGECKKPSAVGDSNGWTLDNSKLQPKSDTTATGYPLEFICPLTRVFKNGADDANNPPLTVQMALGGASAAKPTDCTVYSLTKYGAVKQSVPVSVAGDANGSVNAIKTGKITKTDADGSFSISCKLPNTYPQPSAGVIYGYRSEEKSTSAETKWRTHSGTRCVPTGTGVPDKLRYYFNKAQNVDTASRAVTCPVEEIVAPTGQTPRYTATVYMNEAKAAGGSSCRLVARWHYDSTEMDATPLLSTSATGDKTLPLAILPSRHSDYTLRYSVDCTLTAGSSIYSYTVGY